MDTLAVIDIGPLRRNLGRPTVGEDELACARALDRACRDHGFLLITGHGADTATLDDLDRAARQFFALPATGKAEIAMARGGRAWRGWFPLGGELTSGRPDHKEGLYFGEDLAADHPAVQAGLPLHGPNLFPRDLPALRAAATAWMAAMTTVGHTVVRGLGIGLGLGPTWFDEHLTADPTVLFRIFRYPAQPVDTPGWGVAEHTDYGLVTLLAHDGRPGLQVKAGDGWIDVPAVDDTVVVNLGDMLELMTGGRYRSTPHRVRHHGDPTGRDRLSFPFFFDPGWDVEVGPLPGLEPTIPDDPAGRWDETSVHAWSGPYGDYLTAKVAKVFPELGGEALR